MMRRHSRGATIGGQVAVPAGRPAAPVAGRPIAAALVLSAALAGCAMVGPDYRRPAIELPAGFGEPQAALRSADGAAAASSGSPASAGQDGAAVVDAPVMAPTVRADWWTLYRDPALAALVGDALARNADIAVAAAQVEQAEAVLREANASFYPEVGLAGSSARQQVSRVGPTPLFPGVAPIRNVHQLALSTSFELDLWGRLRRAAEGARAQLLGTRFARDTVALTLAGTVAQTYFLLRSLDAQAAALRSSLALREDTLRVVRARARAGYVSDLDVEQAQGARSDAASQLAEVRRQRAVAEHQLGQLAGRPGLALPAADLRTIPLPPAPPPGLPSSLVERRPDVRAAEQSVAAASARIGVAQAAMLPTFSFTGQLGAQSREFGDLLSVPARIWSLGLGLSLPVIDAGRYAARTRQAEALRDQALAQYRRSVETAFREVADALSSGTLAAQAEQAQLDRLEAARRAEQIARRRYDAGYSGFLELLDAQRTVNDAELAFVRIRQARLAYSVDLMKSLGGGWTDTAPIGARTDAVPVAAR